MNEKRSYFVHLYNDKLDTEFKIMALFEDDIEIVAENDATFELEKREYLIKMHREIFDKYQRVRKVMFS